MFDTARWLPRLLQLASPGLPVGAFSYSQGLEWVIDSGQVNDEASAAEWIMGGLETSFARADGPLFCGAYEAALDQDWAGLAQWNDIVLASRETRELRAETVQMGYSLRQMLPALLPQAHGLRSELANLEPLTFPCAYAAVAAWWGIPQEAALQAYGWGWLDNQVLAAVKAIPLGQTAGQRLLVRLGDALPRLVALALATAPDDFSNVSPGLALASSRHETQYSRMFRS